MPIYDRSFSSRIFHMFNYFFLSVLALLCLLPMIHVLAISFSDSLAVASGRVTFWPVNFHIEAYRRVLTSAVFYNAFMVSVFRVVAGAVVNMSLITITAYPLSLGPKQFKGRNVLMWTFFFTMLFNGGLIPTFMIVRNVGLINNFWVMILPGAIPVFSMIILMNFFKRLPDEIKEAAKMDGAGHFTILFKILIPLSKASLATLLLFSMVGHWNEWFSPLIYMNDTNLWPLQTYLSQLLVRINPMEVTRDQVDLLRFLNNRNFRAAQIFVSTVPILLVYPFLQKYFVKGLVIGAVKG